MKVRFGYTVGAGTDAAGFIDLVDALDELRFDTVWIPEILLGPTLDPIVALTHAAARTTRLKLGAHLILPGKNPVLLARQLAQLDRFSRGRLLLVGVLGVAAEADAGAQLMPAGERGAALDELVPLLRRLWSGEVVDHDGPRYRLSGVQLPITPMQEPLELWLGGTAPSALRRCAAIGDGWMPGFMFPHEAAALRVRLEVESASLGRTMDPEHYGVNLTYAVDELDDAAMARLAARRGNKQVEGLVPVGFEAMHRRIDEWVDAGFSKFLVRPLTPAVDWRTELELLASEVLPRASS